MAHVFGNLGQALGLFASDSIELFLILLVGLWLLMTLRE